MRTRCFFSAVALVLGLAPAFTNVGWAQQSTNKQVAMTWAFRNNHPNIVYMQLYAVQGRRVYPSPSQYYKMDDSQAHDAKILCWEGEKICYGAWTTGTAVWGVGRNNTRSCADCCVSCKDGSVGTRNLNP